MNRKDLQDKLLNDFPRLYMQYSWNKRDSCMPYGFPNVPGWFDILYKLSQDLEAEFQKLPDNIKKHAAKNGIFAASQVKQKFGRLRFHMDHPTPEMRTIISAAEGASCAACFICGADGKQRNMSVYCSEHGPDDL